MIGLIFQSATPGRKPGGRFQYLGGAAKCAKLLVNAKVPRHWSVVGIVAGSPLELGFFGTPSPSIFLYRLPVWELEKPDDLMYSLDNPGKYPSFQATLNLSRIEEAIERREILVYTSADPEEATLKALREKIQLVLINVLTLGSAQFGLGRRLGGDL